MPDRSASLPGNTPEPVRVVLHGPGVTEADVWRSGLALCDLYDSVASSLSGEPVEGLMTVTGVRRMCDGCDATAPGFALAAGWFSAPNGDDFCTACLIGGDR